MLGCRQQTRWLLAVSLGSLLSSAVLAQTMPTPPPPSPNAAAMPEVALPSLPPMPTPTPNAAAPPNTEAPPGVVASSPSAPEQAAGQPKSFSFGTSDISVLFLPVQVSRMKDAFTAYESTNREVKPAPVAPIAPVQQPQEVIIEPPTYPVFFLTSIAYETPDDWSIWIAGHKITSRRNNTDVSVVAISKDSVTLLWKPDYMKAIQRRRNENLFADTAPVKNKLATLQRIEQDNADGSITFTLRQNQSFAVGYFSVFEGYMESPKLLALPIQDPNQPGATGMTDPNGNPILMDPAMTGMPPGAMASPVPPDPSAPNGQPVLDPSGRMMPSGPGSPPDAM